ncbi:DMT family transporter [Nordella sp. HKS 07]|uniref:DMT family transporter n=1 Tax=Nordella sp. HKS 07 TaxID=2712222 RepID=UPI0013E1F5AF|nr:DMT family transporter [Nordella sp. HKS 07]QIG50055.1 DMT family transporter [Nordella sp. HKS 07]
MSEPASKAGLFMILAMASFTAGDTMTKLLAGQLPVGEIILIRGIVATTIIVAVCLKQGVLIHAAQAFKRTILARSLSDMAGTLFFITALMHMPIANLTAIMQAVPLLVIAFAALFLGEKAGLRRTLAILVGLTGVLFIVKPSPSSFTFYDGLSLGLIVAVALRDIITRKLTIDVPTMIVALGNSVIVMLSGLALYPFEEWIVPTPHHLLILFCGGIFLTIGYVSMVLTIRMGDIASTAIYRYSVVLFALISGVFVFGEMPDRWVFLGIALIVASGIYALLREMKISRNARMQSPSG